MHEYGGRKTSGDQGSSTELQEELFGDQILDGGKGIPDEGRAPSLRGSTSSIPFKVPMDTGLGLSVVGALCERYGGKVWVEDRVEGDCTKGSMFNVILPITSQTSEGPAQRRE